MARRRENPGYTGAKGESKYVRTRSDEVYNARRRFRRQAEKYLEKAEGATGVQKERYMAQARAATEKAVSTYEPGKKPQGAVKKLVERLDMGGIAQRQPVRAESENQGMKAARQREQDKLISESYTALQGTGQPTREQMARDILSTGNIGSRFYGGLVQIWDQTPESRRHPNRAILEFFSAETIMDVLEELEERGIDLYAPDTNEDVYKSAQLQLQNYILQTRRIRENER